jgi:hypothetical protein
MAAINLLKIFKILKITAKAVFLAIAMLALSLLSVVGTVQNDYNPDCNFLEGLFDG